MENPETLAIYIIPPSHLTPSREWAASVTVDIYGKTRLNE